MRLITSLLFLSACSGGGTFSSSISDDTNLGDLDEDQVCTLQEEQSDFYGDAFPADDACYFAGQFSAAFAVAFDPETNFEEACETAYQECKDGESEPDEPFECIPVTLPEGCPHTIADFEACQNEAVDAIRELISNKCNEPEEEASEPAAGNPICEAISDECGLSFL